MGKNNFPQKKSSKRNHARKRTGRQSTVCPGNWYHPGVSEKNNLGGTGKWLSGCHVHMLVQVQHLRTHMKAEY